MNDITNLPGEVVDGINGIMAFKVLGSDRLHTTRAGAEVHGGNQETIERVLATHERECRRCYGIYLSLDLRACRDCGGPMAPNDELCGDCAYADWPHSQARLAERIRNLYGLRGAAELIDQYERRQEAGQ